MPCSSGRSSRLPAPTQTPSDAVSRCGISSVTTVRPEGRRVTSTLMQQLLRARRGWSTGYRFDGVRDQPAAPSCVRAAGRGRQASPAVAAAPRRPPRPHRETSPAWAVDSTTIGTAGSRVSFSPPRCRRRCADRRTGRFRASRCAWSRRSPARRRGRRQNPRGCPRAPAPDSVNCRDCGKRRHQRAHGGGVAAIRLEQQALEIGRDLDVHRGRRGRYALRAARRRRSRRCAPGCR